MEAIATIQHFAVDTAFITAIKRNSRALNTRILEEAHLKEFQETTAYYALPIPRDLALAYIFRLVSRGTKFSTIKRKVDSLHYAHRGMISPFSTSDFKETLQGLKNTMNDRNHNQVITKHSKPISKDHLIRVSDELTRLGTNKALRDKTIITLGWMAALRVSEIQNLRVNDFVKEEGGYILKLYKSKNLKAGEVGEKWLPKSKSSICPTHALERYLEQFPRKGNEHLFRSFRRGDIESEEVITRRSLQKLVNLLFGEEYTAHSLRSGFCSSAFESGATYSQVMQQSLHKFVEGLRAYDQSDKRKNNAVNGLV